MTIEATIKGFAQNATMQDVIRERPRDVAAIDALRTGKLDGRLRNQVRAVPTSATDVLPTDAEGDVVTDGTYVYTLIDVSGSLKWDRRSHSTGW